MDVDEVIEESKWSEKTLLETREIVEALVTQEPKIFEEEYITPMQPTIKVPRNC